MNTNLTRPTYRFVHALQGTEMAVLGVLASQLFFLASLWLVPEVSSDPLTSERISDPILGRYGLVQTGGVLAWGVGALGLILLLRARLAPGTARSLGLWLIVIYGFGGFLVGLFPGDSVLRPDTLWSQPLNQSLSALAWSMSSVAIVGGMLVVAWVFSGEDAWGLLTIGSSFMAGVALCLFLVQDLGELSGVVHHAHLTVVAVWIMWVALSVRVPARDGKSAWLSA